MNRLLLLLLLLLAPLLATTRAAGVGAQADSGAPGWSSGDQADLEIVELALPHHVLRRARRTAGFGHAAHLPPAPVALAISPAPHRDVAPRIHTAKAAPAPLRPYVTTLPPPSLA